MERLRQDLRFGVRSLKHSPLFTITAVLTLALGIGLSTAVFTVANALLIRRMPFPDERRVVVVAGATPDNRIDSYPISLDDAREFARASRSLVASALVTYEGAVPAPVVDGDRISILRRSLVAGDFFTMLGAVPLIGRSFTMDDDAAGAAPVALLSHRAWVNRYGAAADIVGRRITLHQSGKTFTVVGVMPEGLDYPRGTDVWLPARAATTPQDLQRFAFNVVGRLAPGASLASVRGEMSSFLQRSSALDWQRKLHGSATQLTALVVGDTRPAVLAFVAACALLLIITCTNVANLLLVRGVARVREMAVRAALGGTRVRLAGQLITEYGVLAIVGGALGGAIAVGAVRAFVAFAPPELPRLDGIGVDTTMLAGGVGISLIALAIFGIAPSLAISRSDAQDVLRDGHRRTGSRRSRRIAEALVAAQVALATIVLAAAALIGRSFVNLQRADLAFDASHLLVSDLTLRASEYETVDEQNAMLDRLLPLVRALPGVEGVSPAVAAPFGDRNGWNGAPTAEGQTKDEAALNPMLNMDVVAPDYFRALNIATINGRSFTDDDRPGAQPVVILSAAAARHYWGTADPIGKYVTMGDAPGAPRLTVVGIVRDTRYRQLSAPQPSIYFPLRQSFFPFAPMTLLIRTRSEPSAIVPALRQLIAERMPGVALATANPFETLLARPLAQPRMNAVLLGVFGASAGLLAAIGLFGVLATAVQQQRRELGIRMALGASASAVQWTVLSRGTQIGAVGAMIGLIAAFWTNRSLADLLYGITPGSASTLAAVAVTLVAISAVASYLPARASSRVDPAIALRAD